MTEEQLPAAFVQRMQAQLGDQWPAFVAALTTEVPTSIRYHAHKARGLEKPEAAVPWHPQGRYLAERPASFAHDPLWHAGAYYVQEASSMAVLQALPAWQRPVRVLDLCAAPGGKTTLLADALPQGSLLVANETIATRNAVLRENVVRWGRIGVVVTQNDPADFVPLGGVFDLVVVDAPCSGEGLWRKQASAIDHWSEAAVAHCATRQARIVEAAQRLVAPGGRLVYSTCTYGPEENDQQLQALATGGDWALVSLPLQAHRFVHTGVGYQAYPHLVAGEGFFLAALDRLAGPTPAPEPRVRPKTLAASWQALLPTAEPLALHEVQELAFALPLAQQGFAALLQQRLRSTLPGLPLWEVKGKTQRPSHGLAVAEGCVSAYDLPLTLAEALVFLQGQALPLQGLSVPLERWEGCVRVTYNGLGLGWAKPAAGRLNNLLPASFRLRSAPVQW